MSNQNQYFNYVTGEEFKEGGYKFSLMTFKDNDVYFSKIFWKPDDLAIFTPYFKPVEIDKKEYPINDVDPDIFAEYSKGDYFKDKVYPSIKKVIAEYFESGKLETYTKKELV